MLKTVYLVRHGETSWNKEWLFQGHQDVELSEKGIEQARRVSERLKGVIFSSIYSSDLRRASKTAQIIAENQEIKVKETSDLREINFGEWEGRRYENLTEKESEYFQKWLKGPSKYRIPGGESLTEMRERVINFLNLVVSWVDEDNKNKKGKKEKGHNKDVENILITAHGGTIKIIIAHVLNMDIKNMSRLVISPASLSIIQYYQTCPYLTLFNDVCYLKDYANY